MITSFMRCAAPALVCVNAKNYYTPGCIIVNALGHHCIPEGACSAVLAHIVSCVATARGGGGSPRHAKWGVARRGEVRARTRTGSAKLMLAHIVSRVCMCALTRGRHAPHERTFESLTSLTSHACRLSIACKRCVQREGSCGQRNERPPEGSNVRNVARSCALVG